MVKTDRKGAGTVDSTSVCMDSGGLGTNEKKWKIEKRLTRLLDVSVKKDGVREREASRLKIIKLLGEIKETRFLSGKDVCIGDLKGEALRKEGHTANQDY